MHTYSAKQFLPISIDEAWDFFSSPKNLAVITPPEMDFKILSQIPENGIFEGQQIDYTVKPILGIPLKWKTEIGKTSKHHFFTDKQLKGPYNVWEHTHTFEIQNNGVMMTDKILYQLPLGFIGKIMNKLFVRNKIESIFEYRRKTLNNLFVQNRKND